VVFEVHNRGDPIAPETLPRIFEPFHSSQAEQARQRGNLGLGLFIAREIVHGHGGTISARSTLEEGTTFTVRLPRSARGEARPGA